MSDQIPPADELFAVRDQIEHLKGRERDLRSLMLSDPSARTGNHYLVVVKDVTTRRTDLTEMRKMYPELVAEYTYPVTEQRVELRGITDDGEVISLRRKTA